MSTPEEAVHQTIAKTLLAGRLAPGTQLVEMRLASVVGISRERIRKVLQRLGHERLLELIPNRGAFVASPDLVQARAIYEARRIIEGGIVGRLAGRLTPTQVKALKAHARREHAALHAGDRPLSITLSGEFHAILGQFCGSAFVQRELQELISRTSMIVAFYEPAAASECACEEHEDITDALVKGDAARAIKAMHAHLSLIETRLSLPVRSEAPADPSAILARAWRAAQKAAV